MKVKYIGGGERVFPTLGITVQSGQEFEAPNNFEAADVVSSTDKTPIVAAKTVGESE